MSKCVHELAQKIGENDEGFLEFAEAMTGVSSCSLVRAINQGKITPDQLNGTNGQSILISDVQRITSEIENEAQSAAA